MIDERSESLVETIRVIDAAWPLDPPMIERWRVARGKAVKCRPFYCESSAVAASISKGTVAC